MKKLKRLKIVVYFLRLINPSYGYCRKCGIPWNKCTPRSVPTDSNSGTFATCEYCWNNSTLDEILDCYIKVYNNQKKELITYGHTLNHTLKHLLNCVQIEYDKNDIKITRQRKIKLLQKKLRKNENM